MRDHAIVLELDLPEMEGSDPYCEKVAGITSCTLPLGRLAILRARQGSDGLSIQVRGTTS